MRLIVQFERHESIKYISQLDMLRTIHRILRRADIPVAYSEGFNPQPKVSFGFALSVGLVSFGEYMDIQLKKDMPEDEFLRRMNAAMPIGMYFRDASAANENVPKIGRMIDSAEYETVFESEDSGSFCDIINRFFGQGEIIMERHSKKGTSFVDIKPWVYDYKVDLIDGRKTRLVTVQALSEQMSIRIDDVVNAIEKFSGLECLKHYSVKKNMLLRYNGSFITPVEYTRNIVSAGNKA